MIKAILLDLNGIFIDSPKLSLRFNQDFGISVDEFLAAMAGMDPYKKPNAGRAYDYWQPYLQKWGLNWTEPQLWDYWLKPEKPSPEIISIAQELRRHGTKVIIVSNNFKERAEFYKHYSWMDQAVDKSYFSWQTGYLKPDISVWQHVLAENNLRPEECLFFDDQEKNTTAASSLGIKSFLYQNPAEF